MGKRTNIAEKRAHKHELICERIARIINCSPAEATQALSTPLRQSVRLNPLIAAADKTLGEMSKLGWSGDSVAWCDNGFSILEGYESLRDSLLTEIGALYIQNQSSWLPVIALDPRADDKILDICAAPGGKTSHMAAITDNRALITANDNSRPRLLRLQRNMERLGARASYTLYDARQLADTMEPAQFDKILLDAPCSGEGLINLSDLKSLDTWSVAHIRRLATLQKRLIYQAWLLLKPGGILAYSTCTMAPEENEAAVDYLLRKHPDAYTAPISIPHTQLQPALTRWNERIFHAGVSNARRIFPHDGNEAFFICLIMKQTDAPY